MFNTTGDSFWIDEHNTLWRVFFQDETVKKQENLEIKNITHVAGGKDHIVVVGENGRCWGIGNNHDGQLSGGTFTYTNEFERIYGIDNVLKVAVGSRNTVFLDCNGTVWACGDNNSNQILSNHFARVFSPTIVAGLPECTAISAGPECIYAVDVDGAVWLTGNANTVNYTEFSVLDNNTLPRKLNFETPIESISANDNTCLFASVDGRTLWRAFAKRACTKSFFEEGIKQISAFSYRSIVLDGAGTLWACDTFDAEFKPFPLPNNELVSFIYPSTTNILYLCTMEGTGYALFLNQWSLFRKIAFSFKFVPLDLSNAYAKTQTKSARKG